MVISNSKSAAYLSDTFISAALEPYGLVLVPSQVEAIRRYLAMLLLWNQKINLTSLVDPKEILSRHFGESMFAMRVVPLSKGRLADVGSGGGFPGLALKLICNQLDVALIEPNQKKAVFLREVTRALELDGVEIMCRRISDLDLTESFDFVTARAVGGVPSLLKWTRNALRKDGQVVLWLGAKDARLVSSSVKGWLWREPILIPQSRHRVLLVGHLRS